MIATDVMATVFSTSGVTALLNAFARTQQAQDNLFKKQAALATAATPKAYVSALKQVETAERSLTNAALQTGEAAVSALDQIIRKAGEAIATYTQFGREVMNIKALTGATARDSTRAAVLGQVAGIPDVAEIKDLLRAGSAVFSPTGQNALGMLGIAANPNQNGLELIGQISDKLNGMQDGLRKTQIMEDIFGAKSVASFLPLLRMTREQRDAVNELADSFDSEGLKKMQQFDFTSKLLQQSFQLRVIFPIVEHLITILTPLIDILEKVSIGWEKVDRATGGSLSWIALAYGIGRVVLVLYEVGKALRSVALWQAFMTALSGPKGLLTVAAAFGAVGIAGYAFDRMVSGGNQKDSATSQFGDHVDRFGNAVGAFTDNLGEFVGGGIPGGFGELDTSSLLRQRALGAIG